MDTVKEEANEGGKT